jgi:hypothetical protein
VLTGDRAFIERRYCDAAYFVRGADKRSQLQEARFVSAKHSMMAGGQDWQRPSVSLLNNVLSCKPVIVRRKRGGGKGVACLWLRTRVL